MHEHPLDDTDAFPILRVLDFFNHAAVAPISGRAAAALREFAQQASSRAYVDSHWYKRVKGVKRLAAQLIGAAGDHEIAFVPNTTSGLALVANGLAWQPGDNVIITNVEYPANRYPWENLKRLGVELIEIPQHADFRIDAHDVIDAITDRTRVVSLSHAQYASGHRIDPAPIAKVVHDAGGYLCIDAIQTVGAMPVDVKALGIDFLAADGHKWMLGPEGCGIFYCHEDLAAHLHPNVVGWMNMVDASNYGDYRLELLPDARRFEPGSYNVPSILALGASLELLLETGLDVVWRNIEALTDRLCTGLEAKGYRILSPRKTAEERSGIVTFDAPEAPEGGPRPAEIVRSLEQQGIIIALREGRLRASPHFYNTAEQIDRLLAGLPE